MTAPNDTGDATAAGDVRSVYGQRVHDSLLDLVDFTEAAARIVKRGRAAYDEDETLRLAGEALTHRIGEAVARLSDAFIADHPEIEWRNIKGMRNIIAHDYGRVDYAILWNALAVDVPELASYVRNLLG